MSNICDGITVQIRKDIADRYFGFRKLIEEDKLDLEQKIRQHSFILEKRIGFDLTRLYILLLDEDLIRNFFTTTGLEQKLFYDPALKESSAIEKRVFEGVRFRGFTRGGRFENFIIDCYERLAFHVELYRKHVDELQVYRETINEEIKFFYQQNDLCAIMEFFRNLGCANSCAGLEGGMETGIAQALEKNMRIAVPLPIEHFLPVIPQPRPIPEIKKELRRISKQAYARHSELFINIFSLNGEVIGGDRKSLFGTGPDHRATAMAPGFSDETP